MINIQKLDNGGIPHYDVGQVSNCNDFIDWLYRLDHKEMSLSFKGYMYRFRTVEERCQFIFGFQVAWEVIDTEYLLKTHGENICL